MNYFKRLRARHWAWIHFKISAGAAWPLYLILVPSQVLATVANTAIINICMGISIFGTLMSVIGYFFSQQPGKAGVVGVSIELSGLCMAVLGPLAYLITRAYILFTEMDESQLTGLFLAYALCAVYLYRFIILIPRFRFEAHDPSKE